VETCLLAGGRKKFTQKAISCPLCGCPAILVEGYQVEKINIGYICPGCKEKLTIGEKTLNMYLETNTPPSHSSID
jgi:transposase-like protein